MSNGPRKPHGAFLHSNLRQVSQTEMEHKFPVFSSQSKYNTYVHICKYRELLVAHTNCEVIPEM